MPGVLDDLLAFADLPGENVALLTFSRELGTGGVGFAVEIGEAFCLGSEVDLKLRGALFQTLDFRFACSQALLNGADLLRLEFQLGTGSFRFELGFGKLGALGGEHLLGRVELFFVGCVDGLLLADLSRQAGELVGS